MPRILLAEDGLTAMNLAGPLFDDPDLELDVVTSGRSALDRLTETPKAYGLVILGYDLPEISGPECIAFIRKMFRRLPILVLSDTTGAERVNELARLGVHQTDILEKPTDPKTFAAWVQKALSEANRQNPDLAE